MAEIQARIVVLDDRVSSQQLAPLLDRLGADGLEALLFSIERDGVNPQRGKALELLAKHLGKNFPHAALEFAADPKRSRLANGMIEAAMATLVRESPDEALGALEMIKSTQQRRGAMSTLLSNLASAHPGLISGWLEKEEVKQHLLAQPWSMRSLIVGLAATSAEEAAKIVELLPKGDMLNSGVYGLASTWAQRDPAAALAWAKGLEDEKVRGTAISGLVGEMLIEDPKSAIALLDGVQGEDRKSVLRAITHGLMNRDPDGALDWLSGLEDPNELASALQDVPHRQFTEESVEKYLGLLGRISDDKRKRATGQFLQQWMQHDQEAALTWAESIEDPKEKKQYVGQLIGNLSYNDPLAAIEIIERFEASGGDLDYYVRNAYGRLASRDLESARDAVDALPDGKTKDKAMVGVVENWSHYEPQAAAEFVMDEYEEGPAQRELLGRLAQGWAQRNAEEALDWANGLGIAPRIAASDQIISHLANNGSPEVARAALESLIAEDPVEASKSGRLDGAIHSVMKRAGKDDPQLGIAMINQLTTEEAQKSAIGPLVESWAYENPEEARDWVAQLGAGSVHDVAAQKVSWKLLSENPAGAFDVAGTIGSATMRLQTMQYAIERLAADDSPEAARAALDAADLSESERQSLRDRTE